MDTLKGVQNKFPRANKTPDNDCKHCRGTGLDNGGPCICLFVTDKELREHAKKELSNLAKEHKKSINNA